MQKVVINVCYGGFGLSRAAFLRLRELGNEAAKSEPDIGEAYKDGTLRRDYGHCDAFLYTVDRCDPQVVQVVEELGEAASGGCAKLRVVEIPDGVLWEITEYDGFEEVEEVHRSWS